MMLELTDPGLATLVQGIPFRGSRHLGMPLAGAADPLAMVLSNWLVGNAAEAAVLESAYAPISMIARSPCTVAVQGAAYDVQVDDKVHEIYQALHLEAGETLRVHAAMGGCRSYIAIAGGIDVATALGATSTYVPAGLGGINGGFLQKGALIEAKKASDIPTRALPSKYRLRYGVDFLLRVVSAPEADWVSADCLFDQSWTVSRRANRIGLELEGTPIVHQRSDQSESSAVFPGTIQCPPSGLPFLLGPDAQTTGGYPRIAQVIRADRHLIGQLRPGARVQFQSIGPEEAQRLYRSKIALIRQLQPDFRLD